MIGRFSLFPDQASSFAGQIDAIYFLLIVFSAVFSILIAGAIVGFAVRFRRSRERQLMPTTSGLLSLEITWSVIPFLITLVFFGWGARLFITLHTAPDDALQVYVVGKQWMWKLQHAEGRREIDELHVPIGKPVKLIMTSEDVIHSFYVPAFRVKQDAVPGRYTSLWFEATKAGEYYLFCAEYCGSQHSRMIGRVVAMEPAEYQTWLSGAPTGAGGGASMETAGLQLFEQLGCATCHQQAAGARGPSLEGLLGKQVKLSDGNTVLADEAYVRESILDPQAKVVEGYQPIMPTFKGQISEEGLLQLIAYIKSLKPTQAPVQANQPAKTQAMLAGHAEQG